MSETIEKPPAAPEEKVTPPVARSTAKPGRKPGQLNGQGKSRSLLNKRKKAGKEAPKAKPQTEAEKIEAFATGAQPKPDEAEPVTAEAGPARRRTKHASMGPDKFAKSLQGLHKGAALIWGPEMALQDGEAKMLADALYDVFSEYDIEIDPKLAAAVNLAGATMIVYGPRVVAARTRRARNRPPVKQPDEKFNAPPPPPPMPPILDGMDFSDLGGGIGG